MINEKHYERVMRMMKSLCRCIGKVCAELLPAAVWNNDAYVHE